MPRRGGSPGHCMTAAGLRTRIRRWLGGRGGCRSRFEAWRTRGSTGSATLKQKLDPTHLVGSIRAESFIEVGIRFSDPQVLCSSRFKRLLAAFFVELDVSSYFNEVSWIAHLGRLSRHTLLGHLDV